MTDPKQELLDQMEKLLTGKRGIQGWAGRNPMHVSETQPKKPERGDLWYKPSTRSLSLYDGKWEKIAKQGIQGWAGKSVTGEKGEKGDIGSVGPRGDSIKGKDGKDADIKAVGELLVREFTKHDKEYDHSLIGKVGTKSVNENGIENGYILKYDLKTDKLIYGRMPTKGKLQGGGGTTLPPRTGFEGHVLEVDTDKSLKWSDKSLTGGYVPYVGATADVNLGSNDLFVLGNVGIGTATVDEKLHIKDEYTGILRGKLENTSTASAAVVGALYEVTNDSGYWGGMGMTSSGSTILGGALVDTFHIYNQGYGNTLNTVDGNKDFVWYTDPADNHNFTALSNEVMRLKADGSLYLPKDSQKLLFGAAQDASITYDGTNLIIDPQVVGDGYVNIPSSVTDDSQVLRLGGAGGYYADLGVSHWNSIRAASTSHDLVIQLDSIGGTAWTGGGGNMTFRNNDTSGDLQTRFTILQDGNLHVNNDNEKLLFGAAQDASITYDGTNLHINTREEGTGHLIVDGGSLGIGGTPSATLEVFGSGKFTNTSGTTQTTWEGAASTFRIGQDGAGVFLTSDTAAKDIRLLTNAGDIYLDGDTLIYHDNDKLLFGAAQDASITYDGTNMVFDSQEVGTGDFVFENGNVGIGTTAPSESLDIVGNIELETTSSSETGVIQKDGTRFIYDFRHPTGGAARPNGNNLFVGTLSGNLNVGSTAGTITEGSNNVGLGSSALVSLTTGKNNMGIGTNVGSAITTGANNVGVGISSLGTVSTGSGNVGVGFGALNLETSSWNVAIGYASALFITAGVGNVTIGRDSGRRYGGGASSRTGGNYCTLVGDNTDTSVASVSEEIVIGHNAIGMGTFTATLGSPSYTDLYLPADNYSLRLGAAGDVSLKYDGTDCVLTTDIVGASDFIVDCGTEKTLELAETVWDDLPPTPVLVAKLGSTAPTLATAPNGTNVKQYTFGVGDIIYGATEITHKYKEGTDVMPHIHWLNNGSDGAVSKYVEWQLSYQLLKVGEGAGAEVVISSGDLEIPASQADGTQYVDSLGTAITGTDLDIGDYIIWELERIASDGDAPAADPFGIAVGFHVECDTIGSRTMTTK